MKFFKKNLLVYLLTAFAVIACTYLASALYSTVTVMSGTEKKPVTLVIDAGHGGEDGGAVAADGTRESDINLEIACKLNDLCRLIGMKTVMVRTDDVSIYGSEAKTIAQKKVSDLKNRVALVNNTDSALLISIHQNIFSDAKYDGAQVFYAATGDSKELAEQLQENLSQVLDPSNHRRVKKSNSVYLMSHISCTGVLVECGFLSNSEELHNLCTAQYQKKLAFVLGSSIYGYEKGQLENEV